MVGPAKEHSFRIQPVVGKAKSFTISSDKTIADLKEMILKDPNFGATGAKDIDEIKLVYGGKSLEDGKQIKDCSDILSPSLGHLNLIFRLKS